jgi:peptide/nickel transport system substrate-binding protein
MTWDDASTRPQPAPRRRMSRRALIRQAAFLGGVALLASACAPAAPPAASATQAPAKPAAPAATSAPAATTASAQPAAQAPAAATKPAQASVAATTAPAAKAQRPQLVVAQTADILTLDPTMHRQRQTQNVHQLIFDSLVHRTDDLKLAGHLAESWKQVDEKTFELKMRAGAKWHDGKPVTAKDVKFSYDRTLDPARKAPRAGLLDMVASTDAPDDATVIIKTNRADPLTLVFLNYHAIVPMADVQEKGDAFFDMPVGAGPFVFKEWKKDERVVMEANDAYWGGPPTIGTLIVRPIPDPSTMLAELESGGIDIAAELPPSLAPQIKGNAKIQSLTAPSTVVQFVGLNTTKAPLDNVQVRQALNYAIDKNALIGSLLSGLATPIPGPLFPEARGFDKSVTGYGFDRDKAKALLKAAGADGGFTFTLDTATPTKELAEAIAGQWKQIGVTATVNVIEAGVMTQKTTNGESDAFLTSWGDSSADAGATYYRHFSSGQRAQFKDTNYSKPELDKLIDDGRAASDFTQRQQIFAQALKIIVDDAPWVFLWQPQTLAAARAGVSGFTPRMDAYLFLDKVTKG